MTKRILILLEFWICLVQGLSETICNSFKGFKRMPTSRTGRFTLVVVCYVGITFFSISHRTYTKDAKSPLPKLYI